MRYNYPLPPSNRFQLSRYFSSAIKWLIVSNTAIYLVSLLAYRGFTDVLALNTKDLLSHPWQVVTYLFLHDTASPLHLIFNMLSLWMFGSPLERDWGTRRFLRFYFTCGIGAGICIFLVDLLRGVPSSTIGASGAIFGLLIAFGILYPRATVIMIIFPIEARYFVAIYFFMVMFGVFQPNRGVSNVAHLGGFVIGFIYVWTMRKGMSLPFDRRSLMTAYQQWQLRRAKRKFQVYMKKHGSDRIN